MKLFARYNRVNIWANILIFLLACIVFYFLMHKVLIDQLDEALDTEKSEIQQLAMVKNSLPEIANTNDQQVYYAEVSDTITGHGYSSQKRVNPIKQKMERTRSLVFGIVVANKYYRITIFKSEEETKDLLELIVPIAMGMIALILAVGFLINRIVLKQLWKPFYHTIKEVDAFQLHAQRYTPLPSTGTDEFDTLNQRLNDMLERVQREYQTLKEFTGNASHEMQTPLSIIANQTELLMQDETVLRNHHRTIVTIEEAASRLSRLNGSLLLLTKIENQLFKLEEPVDWKATIQNRLHDLSELITSQQINMTTDCQAVATVFHQHLADILLGNLLNNAIRYNCKGGHLSITLDATKLSVSNTSTVPPLDAAKIFTRFYRHPETKVEGSGLGLSIVDRIAWAAGYRCVYSHQNNQHIFSIYF